VELKNYKDEAPFPFGTLTIKDMTPETFTQLSMAVVDVPIGAEHPPFAEHRKEKIYVGLKGSVQFTCDGETALVGPGDVLVFNGGEKYSYHNGGYEPGQLLVLQRPNRDIPSEA
jgi:mannose-6-phosphate isomerase-like protein (cupin superfamily)